MHSLTATIDRFERGRAVLVFDDGQELILPKRKLPGKIQEGSVLFCEIYPAEDAEIRKENIARYLLKEILHTNEQEKD
ncbi:MAG TPA: DUF3006 domain-containing protein [Patescibacteria group bacterium]